jgi:hypothetical protein
MLRLFKTAHFWPFLGTDYRSSTLDGDQFRVATGISDGFDSVFGRESSHQKCLPTLGCHLDRSSIYPLHVFDGASVSADRPYNKFRVFFHDFLQLARGDKEKMRDTIDRLPCKVARRSAFVSEVAVQFKIVSWRDGGELARVLA